MAWPTYSLTTAVSGLLGHGLDGPPDLVEPGPRPELLDPGPQALLGHLDQALGFGGHLADGHGEGGVSVVPLDDGPAVDGDDVAVLQDVVPGDAVDDHVVGRGADHGREAPVVEEVGLGPPPVEHLPGHPRRARPWSPRAWPPPGWPRASRPPPVPPVASWRSPRASSSSVHPSHRPVRRHRDPPRRWRLSSTARMIRRRTASGDPIPLTLASWPRDEYQSIRGAVWRS